MKTKKIMIIFMVVIFAGLGIAGVLSTKELAFTARDAYVITEKDNLIASMDYLDISDKVCNIDSLVGNSTYIFCFTDVDYSINGTASTERIYLRNDTTPGEDYGVIFKSLRYKLEEDLGIVEDFSYVERVWAKRVIDEGVLVIWNIKTLTL